MSPSSQWTLFIARPGRDRQHVIGDPQGEPRIIFGEDDGMRINDRLEQDPTIVICDPDFEIRLEILDTGSHEEDQGLGRKVVALINTYFTQHELSDSSASSVGASMGKHQTGSRR